MKDLNTWKRKDKAYRLYATDRRQARVREVKETNQWETKVRSVSGHWEDKGTHGSKEEAKKVAEKALS